jgi:hypothetical protein
MRIAPWLMMVFALAGAASAEQASPKAATEAKPKPDDAYVRAMDRLSLLRRAFELRPQRRDEPLRYLNITDNEVREIQFVAEKVVPKAIVNISPVVTGCPCEEGPHCTEQVYIVANGADKSSGLQLSRIKDAWVVGQIQQWWIRYDALRARRASMEWRAYDASEAELLRELPQCVGELVPATTASTTTEGKK